jgi:RHS repeat-associated protein
MESQQQAFHISLEISQKTRDSHIPTAPATGCFTGTKKDSKRQNRRPFTQKSLHRHSYNAVAQPISAVDVANSITYASNGLYAPQGGLSQVLLGSNLTLTHIYNDRLQPCWMYATTGSALPTADLCNTADPGPGNILDLQYGFNPGTDNGNVVSIGNNRDTTRSQTFSYDQVNRMVSGQTSATTGSNCWGESFTYDQWANLNAISALSSYTGCTQDSLSVSSTTGNQISASGISYDASGNMLTDNINTYGWNAESELKSAAGVNYTYDGDGDRLEKSSGELYWHGAGGQILDESNLSGNFTNEYVFFSAERIAMRNVSSGTIYYYAEDMLGSSRTIVQAGQTSLCYDADFTPFGTERVVNESCSSSYKFEGKERDTETGNDDFDARYYSYRFGRWLSSDWSSTPVPVPYANLSNPQSLNLYAMVSDNPETFADLDGHFWSPDDWFSEILSTANERSQPSSATTKDSNAPSSQSPAQQQSGSTTATGDPIQNDLQKDVPGVSTVTPQPDPNLDKPHGGHQNETFALTFKTPKEQAAFLKESGRTGLLHKDNGFGPGVRLDGGLHAEHGRLDPTNPGAILVTSHIDRFNPNNGLGPMIGHFVVDVAIGSTFCSSSACLDH